MKPNAYQDTYLAQQSHDVAADCSEQMATNAPNRSMRRNLCILISIHAAQTLRSISTVQVRGPRFVHLVSSFLRLPTNIPTSLKMNLLMTFLNSILNYVQIFTQFRLKAMKRLIFRKPDTPPKPEDYPDPFPWLEGTRICRKFGKVVVKCHTKDGIVARKVGQKSGSMRTEAFMGKYAREVAGMSVPAFRGLQTREERVILTTDFDPGQPLDAVWSKMTHQNQASIKQELKQQIQLMRKCKTNFLCCTNQQGELDPKIPVPDPYHPGFSASRLKSNVDEATFDAEKVEMVKRRGPKNYALKLERMVQELPKDYTGRFVLTHGDLCASNILVQETNQNNSKDKSNRPRYVISSIIDWQFSGFFPEYMEYAIMKTRPGLAGWERNLVCGVLEEMGHSCSKARLEVEKMVRDPLG